MNGVLLVTEEWAGSGHHMAAMALQQALHERGIRARIIGGLATASPVLRQLSRRTYMACLRHVPRAWERVYQRDAAWSRLLQKPLGMALSPRLLERVIDREMPDVVVATHAYCLSALAVAKRRARRPYLLGGVLTDFHVHRFWTHPHVDFFVVAHEAIRARLAACGIDPVRIYVHGIPVRLEFAEALNRSREAWREALGLKRNAFTVLILGGGAGFVDHEPLIRRLLRSEQPPQIVAVAGHNHSLHRRLEALAREAADSASVRVLGYVPQMWEWMGAADAVLTKPGGLTCAEALALGKPLLLYQPLPGPERHNSRFLREQGAAEEADTPDEAAAILERWQREGKAEKLRPDLSLVRPNSARDIADLIVSLMRERSATG